VTAPLFVVVHTEPDGATYTLGTVTYTDPAVAHARVDERRKTAAEHRWADRYEVRRLAAVEELSSVEWRVQWYYRTPDGVERKDELHRFDNEDQARRAYETVSRMGDVWRVELQRAEVRTVASVPFVDGGTEET